MPVVFWLCRVTAFLGAANNNTYNTIHSFILILFTHYCNNNERMFYFLKIRYNHKIVFWLLCFSTFADVISHYQTVLVMVAKIKGIKPGMRFLVIQSWSSFILLMWKAFQFHLFSIHLLSCTTRLTNAHGKIPPKHLLITSLFWSLGNKSKPYVQLYPVKEQLSLIGTAFIETTVNYPLCYCVTIDCFSDTVLHNTW